MSGSLRVSATALSTSLKTTRKFSATTSIKPGHVSSYERLHTHTNKKRSSTCTPETKTSIYPLVVVDIQNKLPIVSPDAQTSLSTIDVNATSTSFSLEARTSLTRVPIDQSVTSGSFIRGNWRYTDARGLIKGTGNSSDGPRIAGITTQTLPQLPPSNQKAFNNSKNHNWRYTDGFGVTRLTMNAHKKHLGKPGGDKGTVFEVEVDVVKDDSITENDDVHGGKKDLGGDTTVTKGGDGVADTETPIALTARRRSAR